MTSVRPQSRGFPKSQDAYEPQAGSFPPHIRFSSHFLHGLRTTLLARHCSNQNNKSASKSLGELVKIQISGPLDRPENWESQRVDLRYHTFSQ